MSLRCLVISLAPVIVLTIASYRSPEVSAFVGFQPISPDELKMTREPLAPGASAIILFRQVDRDDTGHTAHEDNYVRIKILTEEGRKYGDIEIPFYKGQGNNITGLRGRTIRPDGSIVNYEGKVFEKAIVKRKGLRYMAKTFTLPDVQIGSIIEYYYTYDFSEYLIYDSHWILSDELFTKKASFSMKPHIWSYTPIGVRWSWQRLPEGTGPPKEGPDHIIRLEAANIPAFQTEDFMPPENELKSRVDFTYSESLGAQTPDKFWKETGKKMNDELESFVGKRKAMEQAVAQIVSPNDSDEERLQKIYARVQQIRNTSFEVRKTEQEQKREKEKDLNNVEEVWKRGYGDGTQLTWLYLALVRAAGFEAYGVWASERQNYFFNPQQMDRYKLDANLVLVKLKGMDIYCDPGGAFTPFKLLTWSETGVQGLRLDKDGGSWVRTMLPPSSDSRIERKADLKLSDTGDLEGNLTVTFTGLEALQRRVEERNVDEAERRKFLEDQVKEYIPAASEVDLKNKPDWNSSAVPLVAEFGLKVPGWVSGAGRRAVIPVGLFSATEQHLFDHAVRVHPIYFEFPFQKIDDITIELPAGWQTTSLPAAQTQDGKVVVYTLKVESDKNKLHLTRKLAIDLLLAEAKYYPAVRNFFQTVRTGDEEQIVLQPGATLSVN